MKKTVMTMVAILAIACNKNTAAPAAPAANAVPPPPAAAAASAPAGMLSGRVLETFNSAGYTYLRLETGKGEEWAAVRETSLQKGATVRIAVQMTAENFESSSLKRKFDRIVFGSLSDGNAAAATSGAPAMGGPEQHMQAPDMAGIRVDKPAGGMSVAELWAGRSSQANRPVAVRGKVVKFLTGIMGKNWIHLRDGSGSPEKGDHDITITTNEVVKVGDVITVNGTLRVDKDFGAGYVYPVIVEDGKVGR